MQNLGQLSDWSFLLKGEHVVVPRTASQAVTIRVNAPADTPLYYWLIRADGTFDKKVPPVLLALVRGLDEVRFFVDADIVIEAGGDLMIETKAGLELRPAEAGESFTRIIERRTVSPDVSAVLARANANQRAMMRQMAQLVAAQQSMLAAQNAAAVQVPENKSEVKSDEYKGTGDSARAKAGGTTGSDVDRRASAESPAGKGEGDGSGT